MGTPYPCSYNLFTSHSRDRGAARFTVGEEFLQLSGGSETSALSLPGKTGQETIARWSCSFFLLPQLQHCVLSNVSVSARPTRLFWLWEDAGLASALGLLYFLLPTLVKLEEKKNHKLDEGGKSANSLAAFLMVFCFRM